MKDRILDLSRAICELMHDHGKKWRSEAIDQKSKEPLSLGEAIDFVTHLRGDITADLTVAHGLSLCIFLKLKLDLSPEQFADFLEMYSKDLLSMNELTDMVAAKNARGKEQSDT